MGAHRSGLIGEDPTKPFTNLMPYIAQVALRHKPELVIFGGDYSTNDGTGIEMIMLISNDKFIERFI